jgi:hypothetical protein
VKRYVMGHLRGSTAEPGTLIGPNDLGEFLVVIDRNDDGTSVGYAQSGDIEAALAAPEPRSVAEFRLRVAHQTLPDWCGG